jgi:hypothetical protein
MHSFPVPNAWCITLHISSSYDWTFQRPWKLRTVVWWCHRLDSNRTFPNTNPKVYALADFICKYLLVGLHKICISVLSPRFYVLMPVEICFEIEIQNVQCDSKLLSGFPWPVIFRPETTK